MLMHQGAEAFKLWTGCDAPIDVMRAALEESFGMSQSLGALTGMEGK